jgi:hypothetical protein
MKSESMSFQHSVLLYYCGVCVCSCVCMCVLEQVASTEADLVGLKQQLGVFMGRMDKEICSKADIQALQVRWLGSFY